MTIRPLHYVAPLLILLASGVPAAARLKVVTTLPSYAAIARDLGGDRVEAIAISRPNEDAHFVKPKPSLALMLSDADLFVTTGLDLEIWGPTLVDKSGNRKIRDGQPGFVAAAEGVHMRDVPASASRAGGDVHVFGNPHIHTSPINAKVIASNIVAGLLRVDPAGSTTYVRNLEDFHHRLDVALYGERLVEILGAEVLDPLAEEGSLLGFLDSQSYQGRPLSDYLGGWLATALPLRERKVIAYHKNWIYFTDLFGIDVADYVESKPGIPPSARHVHQLIRKIEADNIPLIMSATYFDASKPQAIGRRTGCSVVRLPLETGDEATPDYFSLVDAWIHELLRALNEER
jgi:ABC-type Zn uptake system ZnuABC Zn-binding protein ZnuA